MEIEYDDETGNEFEVIRTGWTESHLYEQLDDMKYLFVVFQEDSNGDIIFRESILWAMSDEDIELAFNDWVDIRKVLKEGAKLIRAPWGNDERTNNNFPARRDESICVSMVTSVLCRCRW